MGGAEMGGGVEEVRQREEKLSGRKREYVSLGMWEVAKVQNPTSQPCHPLF